MIVTEVRLTLAWREAERLVAYCSVTFDQAFVVHDLRIIQGKEELFVAMPSRKITDRCPQCGGKNILEARFCQKCGSGLAVNRAPRSADGRAKLYTDIAHPVGAEFRRTLQEAVLRAYWAERERDKRPNAVHADDDGNLNRDFGEGILG